MSDYTLPRHRITHASACESCGGQLDFAQDPDDDGFPGPLEVSCPAARDCEAPGCMIRSCGDGADGPEECCVCALWFCASHILIYGDQLVCETCYPMEAPPWHRDDTR